MSSLQQSSSISLGTLWSCSTTVYPPAARSGSVPRYERRTSTYRGCVSNGYRTNTRSKAYSRGCRGGGVQLATALSRSAVAPQQPGTAVGKYARQPADSRRCSTDRCPDPRPHYVHGRRISSPLLRPMVHVEYPRTRASGAHSSPKKRRHPGSPSSAARHGAAVRESRLLLTTASPKRTPW
jgi:hypothetical protein